MAPHHGGVHGETEHGARPPFLAHRKVEAVLRVLRGEDLDLVSHELGLTAARLSEWRDSFLAAGQTGLKSLAADGRDDELARLKALVGDLTMRLELSREAVRSGCSSRPNETRPLSRNSALLSGGIPYRPWQCPSLNDPGGLEKPSCEGESLIPLLCA